MIGSVNVGGTTATLSDAGVWRSKDRLLAAHLNRRYNPADDGPAAGQFGRGAVVAAARALGGEHWLAPPTDLDPDEGLPGVVY